MSGERLVGQAHLYLADPDDWTGGDRLAAVLALLSPDERRRYERFRVAAPARAFATGRALAREVLSLYAETTPGDWSIEPDEHGRPRITGPAGGFDLEFNLSHNDRLVACLVTGGQDCGVDVESLARRVDPLRIAAHSFGEEEAEDLKGLTGADRRQRFFAYWTLKEAYLKACGRGIAMRLDSALFELPPTGTPGEIRVRFASRIEDHADDWQFVLYEAGMGQLLAVALRRDAERDLEISAFRALPGDPRAAAERLEIVASSHPAVSTDR